MFDIRLITKFEQSQPNEKKKGKEKRNSELSETYDYESSQQVEPIETISIVLLINWSLTAHAVCVVARQASLLCIF